MKTAMTTQYTTDPKYKDYNDYIIGRTPAARWGNPEDLKGAVIFLASPASDFVTGTSIVVDGGILAK
jgi:2-deoxy-D-gluconate 3-dehydrogenase